MDVPRSIRRMAAAVGIALATSTTMTATCSAAQAAGGLTNSVTAIRHVSCWEYVWFDGVHVRMTFPQAGDPMPTVATAPGSGAWTPFMHGYYVICSPEGISTGACEYSLRTIPGGGSIPLAVSVRFRPGSTRSLRSTPAR